MNKLTIIVTLFVVLFSTASLADNTLPVMVNNSNIMTVKCIDLNIGDIVHLDEDYSVTKGIPRGSVDKVTEKLATCTYDITVYDKDGKINSTNIVLTTEI